MPLEVMEDIMGLRIMDLDNETESKNYKKEKNHSKFKKENRMLTDEDISPSYVNEEDPEEVKSKDIGTNLLAKVVKIDQLRVRRLPEGEIIRIINKGDEVRIVSDFDDIWFCVELADGTRGYCMKTFLLTYLDDQNLDDKSRRCKSCPTSL
jgi:hypothetical protein